MTTDGQTPDERAQVDALFTHAERLETARRWAEAAATYRQILEIKPELVEAHHNLGNVAKAQGQLDQAVAHYRQALALKPNVFQTHYNLGCVLQSQGQFEAARGHFEQVLALAPKVPEAHFAMARTLKSLGRFDEALARYASAIALRPNYAEAHNNLGTILLARGQLDEAAAHFERALAVRPRFANAHNNLGLALRGKGELNRAASHLEQAVALEPGYAEAFSNLGAVLRDLGRLDEAVARLEAAIALRPGYVEAQNNLGIVLLAQGKVDEAVATLESAIASRPDYAEAHNQLALALWRQNQFARALAHCRQALAVKPDAPEVLCNLANLLLIEGKLDEAAAACQQALSVRPDYAEAHYTLGNVLWPQARLDEAMASYDKALGLRPEFAEAQLGQALCHLVREDYERGWAAYEARWRLPDNDMKCSLPPWSGQPLEGRSLLLVAEQGLGDTLQFIRFARPLRERGARVVLACSAAIAPLMASCSDVDETIIRGSREWFPRYDFYLPLLSVTRVLGTVTATIPAHVPYIAADQERTEKWHDELAKIEGFKIGVVWQGSRDFNLDRWRSVALADLAPLARLPGVHLVSLQKGFGQEQIAAVDFPVIDLGARLDEGTSAFLDTAAVIKNLDLVVAPDTSIGHLAGALGSPVFLAVGLSPNWRWLLDRDDTPWYPTMRLFRQTKLGCWSDVFERMAAAVDERRRQTG